MRRWDKDGIPLRKGDKGIHVMFFWNTSEANKNIGSNNAALPDPEEVE